MASGELDLSTGALLADEELIDNAKLNALVTELILRIKAGAITARELADGSISADKLSADISAQLGVADGSVTSAKIVAGAVTAIKLATAAVTNDKLDPSVIHGLTAGTALVDADEFAFWNLADGLRRLTRAQLAALLPLPGGVVQSVSAVYTANVNLTNIIPQDNTIPQIGEGTQILSASITPKSVNNKILVEVFGSGSANADSTLVIAFFLGAGPGAFYAIGCSESGARVHDFQVGTIHEPASVATLTYSVNVGPGSAATWRLNGSTTGSHFGGLEKTTLRLTELKG